MFQHNSHPWGSFLPDILISFVTIESSHSKNILIKFCIGLMTSPITVTLLIVNKLVLKNVKNRLNITLLQLICAILFWTSSLSDSDNVATTDLWHPYCQVMELSLESTLHLSMLWWLGHTACPSSGYDTVYSPMTDPTIQTRNIYKIVTNFY